MKVFAYVEGIENRHREGQQLVSRYYNQLWKDEYYSKNSSTITVHIRHLREKLKDTSDTPQYIKTIWGVGYKI